VDAIRFEVSRFEGEPDEVEIYINDRNLIEILREIELPYEKAEGHPDLAGGYIGLPLEDVAWPSKHFLGDPTYAIFRYGEKTEVLICPCGTPGCWPFLVKITVGDGKVIWSDFEQPHREKDYGRGLWTYETLKPFVFDQAQYIAELARLSGRPNAS